MSSIASDLDHGSVNNQEDRAQMMRRRLKYYFMNPCEKYRAKKKIPWKLILQVLKIILVTIQIVLFGFDRSAHVEFLDRTNVAFKHLYLIKWDPSFETMPYPPATGKYAVYTIPNFYESVNYILQRFNDTGRIAIGTYYHVVNDTDAYVTFCKTHYKEVHSYSNGTYSVDDHKIKNCTRIKLMGEDTVLTNGTYDIDQTLQDRDFSMFFDRILVVNVHFAVRTLHIKSHSRSKPACYQFNITISYHNGEHDGQMLVDLSSKPEPMSCSGSLTSDISYSSRGGIVALNLIIIIISCSSMLLCIRSIYQAQKLRRLATEFFRTQYSQELTIEDKMEFLNGWYLMIIVNDFLVILGSAMMIPILMSLSQNYEPCGVCLGTANLLVWLGVLRYLTFFETYNILILTIRTALPHIVRFLVCALVFYIGFLVCGWVILGPYHIKFRYLSTASECLFSLINGDDMYVTFQAIPYSSSYIWIYSRIYLYVFISLFIYVVLNLFITIIIDVYETIKDYYQHGFPLSTLQKFVEYMPEEQARFPAADHSPCNSCLLAPCYAFCCTRAYEPESEEAQQLLHHQHNHSNSQT